MSEREAIARGLIPDPKTQYTTPPPTDPGTVFDREQYNREQSIPKLASIPKPAPTPAQHRSDQAGAFSLMVAAIVGWLVGFICGLRMGQ